uniref:lysoplasmalogenase n=1 Tax=Wuchereria bancrofti TaxID=6293 RepID=A0A1I8ETW9_WUCBA
MVLSEVVITYMNIGKKTLPVLILSILYYAVGSSFSNRQRIYASLGLLAGAIGDYMITRPNDGLILGAACFAIGHIFYLVNIIVIN